MFFPYIVNLYKSVTLNNLSKVSFLKCVSENEWVIFRDCITIEERKLTTHFD